VTLYERAVATDPSLPEAYQGLAAALLQRGDLARALAASESALAMDPRSTSARLNFALALERAGYPADAAAEAEQIIARDSGEVAAHLLLGNLYAQRLNSPARARQHYRRVIELNPGHPQSSAIRDWLASQATP
jgi:tetratricopeptide (TPR) repeat protein